MHPEQIDNMEPRTNPRTITPQTGNTTTTYLQL